MKIKKQKILGIAILLLWLITLIILQTKYSDWYIHPLLIVRVAMGISFLGGLITMFDERRIWPILGFVALAVAWIGAIVYIV